MVQRKTTFAVAVQVQNAVLVEFVAGRTLVARTDLCADLCAWIMHVDIESCTMHSTLSTVRLDLQTVVQMC